MDLGRGHTRVPPAAFDECLLRRRRPVWLYIDYNSFPWFVATLIWDVAGTGGVMGVTKII